MIFAIERYAICGMIGHTPTPSELEKRYLFIVREKRVLDALDRELAHLASVDGAIVLGLIDYANSGALITEDAFTMAWQSWARRWCRLMVNDLPEDDLPGWLQ